MPSAEMFLLNILKNTSVNPALLRSGEKVRTVTEFKCIGILINWNLEFQSQQKNE